MLIVECGVAIKHEDILNVDQLEQCLMLFSIIWDLEIMLAASFPPFVYHFSSRQFLRITRAFPHTKVLTNDGQVFVNL